MNENAVEETLVDETPAPAESKFATFKSKITREGIITGGTIIGITIAAGWALLKMSSLEDDQALEAGDPTPQLETLD